MAPAKVARARVGRPSSYKPEYAKMARHLCKLGATDADLAEAFGVSVVTIDNWKIKYPEFLGSLKASKEEADNRVERSLYARATGYSYDAVKIFHTKDGKIIKVPYTEHVPPDVTAQIYWLKNRRPRSLARRAEHRSAARSVHHQRAAAHRGGMDQGARLQRRGPRPRGFPSASQNRVMLLALVNP